MPITLNGDTGITTPSYGGADTAEYLVPVTTFKNRIINGGMTVDQRNNGASTTTANNYPVDRFNATFTDGTITRQQSSTVPAGFSNSLSLTVTSSSAGNSSTRSIIEQRIEGYNVADLGFGTANTQNFTVSFWCRSSVSGTYSGSITDTSTRSYPFSFSIPSTNTWTQISVTITPDTSGSNWSKTTGTGLALRICLGSGSSFLGTANAWASANLDGVTGTTNWINNAGATFFLTGVQLEVGNNATFFDARSIGQETLLCQRYFWQLGGLNNANAGYIFSQPGNPPSSSGGMPILFPNPAPMRVRPDITLNITAGNNSGGSTPSGTQWQLIAPAIDACTFSGSTVGIFGISSLTTSGFTALYASISRQPSEIVFGSTAWLRISAEL